MEFRIKGFSDNDKLVACTKDLKGDTADIFVKFKECLDKAAKTGSTTIVVEVNLEKMTPPPCNMGLKSIGSIASIIELMDYRADFTNEEYYKWLMDFGYAKSVDDAKKQGY